jgi:ubiquinone/menaquinone biosynthesis C-methylase UbiE
MLPRTLEPEVMDTPEEARDYDAMDHSGVNRIFVDDFLVVWDGRNPILDVGTGTAQIPIELCRRQPKAFVTAIDLAEQMLLVARANVNRAALVGRVFIKAEDAKWLTFKDGFFSAVISNSIVHHIPQPHKVLAEMVRVVVPHGVLFVRDLLRPADDQTRQRLVDLYTAGANDHQKQMFSDSLRAALTLAEVRDLVSALAFDPLTVQQTTDRHWTWNARKPG